MDRKSGTRPPFLARLIATGFYSGYSPIAPGTAGSMVGLGLALLPGIGDLFPMTGLIIAMFFVGVFVSDKLATRENSDPQIVVIDEIVGMWISLYLLPKTFVVLLSAFLLFRLLDIVKPFPARQAERLQGGWGIMLDDVAAGVYTNIVCTVIFTILR